MATSKKKKNTKQSLDHNKKGGKESAKIPGKKTLKKSVHKVSLESETQQNKEAKPVENYAKILEPDEIIKEPSEPQEEEFDDYDKEHGEVTELLDENSEPDSSHATTLPASAEAKALARPDALSAYLSEISRYKILSAEEEHEIAVKYFSTGDPEAAFKLVTSNLALVVKISLEYYRGSMMILDLIQEGNVGLMQAVKKFNPYRGVRLPSYAQWWIRAYILRFILSNFRMVKIGTSDEQKKLFYNLKKERDQLIREGFEPSTKLLAARLDVPESDVEMMTQRLAASETSLDTPIDDEGATSVGDLIASSAKSPEEEALNSEFQAIVQDKMNKFAEHLNERELVFWHERISSEEPATLQELADRFKITRERARQIDEAVRKKFRRFIENTMDAEELKEIENK